MSSKLSSLLVQDGVVSVKRMEEAFQRQVIFGGSLDTILLEMNVVDEGVLQRFLYASTGVPAADLTGVDYQRAQEQTKLFPQKLAEKYLIAPVDMSDGALRVLVTDPPDRSRLDELGFMLGATIIPFIVPEFRLYQALELVYGVKMPLRYAGLVKRLGDPPVPDETAGAGEAGEAVADAPTPVADDTPPDETVLDDPAPETAPEEPAPEAAPDVPPPEASPAEAGWDDPYAGAKPDTLVGMAVVAPETLPEAEPEEVPPAQSPAQVASGEIDPSRPAEPAPEPAPIEQTQPMASGEIEVPQPQPEPQPEPQVDAKQTVIGMAAHDLLPPTETAPPEPEPEPKLPVAPEPEPEPAPQPQPEPAPQPEPEPEPQPEPEPVVGEFREAELSDRVDGGEPEASRSQPQLQVEAEDMTPIPAAAPPAEFSAPAPEAPAAPPVEPDDEQPFDATPMQFEDAVEALGDTSSRDDIFALLLKAVCGYFEYSAVYTVFGDQAVGRMAINKGRSDMQAIAQVSIPLTLPSIFRTTVDSKGYYFGPIYDEGINFGLLAEMERPVPASAFIMPVLIRNRVVCFLYADDGLRPVDPALPESLVFISYQISQSFQRLILRAKREEYSAATQTDAGLGKVDPTDALPRRTPSQQNAWAEAPLTSGPATARAPQQDGALQDAPAAQPTVQPAFPDLPGRGASADNMTVAGEDAEAPAPEAPEPQAAPQADALPREPEPSQREGRAITSVGYYSLTDSSIQDEVRGSTGAGGEVKNGAAAGVLDTAAAGTPSAPVTEESPVRVADADTVVSTEPVPRTEDIWSLIDDLERGGELGDLAAAALQRTGDPALKLLAFRFPGRLSQERMGQHGKLPPPSAHGPLVEFMVRMKDRGVPFLVELLDSDNPEVRYYATYIFAELKAPQVLQQLLERVFDSAPPVRRITVEVFKHYVDTAELNAVLEHLRAELIGPVPFRRRCASEVLGSLRDVAAVPRLIELAADRDAETAEAAQRALLLITKQAFGDSKRKWKAWWDKNRERHRVQWLIDALGHKESECRFLASQELHQVTGETLGYRFDQEKRDRDEAIRRWESWWDQKGRNRFLAV